MIQWTGYTKFLLALFAVTNPFGNLAIFIGLTSNKTKSQQHVVAFTVAITVSIILVISVWVGKGILSFFGITLADFELAGGVVLLLIGLSMLQIKTRSAAHTPEEDRYAKQKESVAVVPLAIPIIAGPGAISAVVVNAQHYPTTIDHVVLSIGCIVIALVIGILFFFASYLARILGPTGLKILARIMGLLLASIAFGLIVSGLTSAFPVLT